MYYCKSENIPDGKNNERGFIKSHHWAHVYQHGLTFIQARISIHTSSNLWDGITYPFLKFKGCAVEV